MSHVLKDFELEKTNDETMAAAALAWPSVATPSSAALRNPSEKAANIRNHTGKRLFDVAISGLACIILLPALFVVALIIKLTSKGPVLFKQRRVGLHKSHFDIYKFRTMYINAPGLPTRVLHDAARYLTPIGRFLRKSSIDELPQLINVLRGEMSLVGPRPVIPREQDLIELREASGANDILPGITGLAQINGRDRIGVHKKARIDGYYVEHWSLWLDVRIVLRTIWKIFTFEGVVNGDTKVDAG